MDRTSTNAWAESGVAYEGYAADPGLNATALKQGIVSPLHMHAVLTGEGKETTPAMRWGTLAHLVVLEPERFHKETVMWTGRELKSGKNKGETTFAHSGAEWEEFEAEAERTGRTPVDEPECDELLALSNSVHANRHAHRLIAGSEHELSLFWTDRRYGPAKARVDGYGKRSIGLVEYKTTAQVAPEAFGRTFFNLHYGLQLAWYRHALQTIYRRKTMPVHVIVSEAKPPHDCVVYRVSDEVLDAGYERAVEVAMRYRICEHLCEYPGVSSEIEELSLPAWAKPDVELDFTGTE